MHRLGHLQQQLARAHHEPCVGIADPGGKFVESARHAGVRIGSEQNFTRTSMALLRQRGVTNTGVARSVLALELTFGRFKDPVPVRVVNHVVEIGQALLLHELTQSIHVAVRLGVGRENVVVGHDHDLVPVPDLRVLAELAPEHAYGSRPADVMCHQNVRRHPEVFTRLDTGLARRACENFFGQRHKPGQA